MGITIKIANVDRTSEIDARSLSITDELTSRVNSASFVFTTNDKTIVPIAGQTVLIEEGSIKLFSGRVLSREESFLPPNLLTYNIGCIDYTRDLDKKLVVESYSDMLAGDIIRDILTKYTTGFTTIHVQNGDVITKIDFDYIQVSQALTTIAETCGYEWYVDYDKDIWFFFKTDYPAPFQLDDNQLYYRDLVINYDVSQLRNRVYIKSTLLTNVFHKDDAVSIAAIQAIEGGDGIFEHCITDNNIDIEEWALDVANADLLQNSNPVIKGTFTTNRKDIRSGQIITVNSTKRNISQAFLVQTVNLIRVDTVTEYGEGSGMYYKPAAEAVIGYKPAATAEIPYKPAGGLVGTEVTYYIYEVTIATHLKGLEDLLLQLIYQQTESIKRDKIPPAVPSGLTLSTGMGSITQASLAWLKATWDANTEDDFSHYELKYRKTAYSDFGLVTTTNVSFIWTGLEQGIEYEVSICAVDIYNNRSSYSSVKLLVTATDSTTPAQITGAVATAILAGVKITWTGATEDNIAGYAVERQESSDGTTWTGAWTERVRLDAYMWLDLLLTYTMYYRYRIKAFTQAGIEGATSTPTANSIAPLKTGANDIVAKCITADQIYGTNLAAIFADLGTITAGNITLNNAGYIRSSGKAYGDTVAGFWMGYTGGAYKLHIGTVDKYLMWDGVNLNIKGTIQILGGSGIANLTDAGDLALLDSVTYAAITGTKPPANADHTADIVSALAYYNLVTAALLDSTIIVGGFIKTSLLTADNIKVGTISGVRFNVGGGTSEDIYFMDSGIRLYDVGDQTLAFYKSGYKTAYIAVGTISAGIVSSGHLFLGGPGINMMFYSTGQLKIGVMGSAPTSNNVYGEIIFDNLGASGKLHIYTTAWRNIASSLGW